MEIAKVEVRPDGRDQVIRGFLEVYRLARDLRRRVYSLVGRLPANERYGLIDQMKRAALLVTSNIAEGYGRYHYQENIQFCRQARGSLNELLDHLSTAHDLGYMGEAEFSKYHASVIEAVKLINGYIRMLRKRKAIDD